MVQPLQAHVLTIETESGNDGSFAGVAPTGDGEVELRAAALDAYRVCLQLFPLCELPFGHG